MLGALGGFIATLFSSSKAVDVAADGLKRLGGLDDMSPQEKTDAYLKALSATQKASYARRFIALLVTSLYALCVLLWLLFEGVGMMLQVHEAQAYANSVFGLLKEVLANPFNIVLGFYFLVDLGAKMKR